jgi:outer membrane protein OmpA-like peptidoglycan-associated protein
MTLLRLFLVMAVVSLPAAGRAQLSDGGRFEVGALASYTRFDPERLPFANDFGAGLRSAVFLSRVISVEAFAHRILTQNPTAAAVADVSELGGTVLASFALGGRNRVYVGAGYAMASHSGWASFSDQAVHVVLGDRIPLSRMAALRIEGRAVRIAQSNVPSGADGAATNVQVSVGVSFFARALPPRDTDGDMIPDRFDRCAATDRGLLVDGTGCPRDTDVDGVFDGMDQCPATDSGTEVDARGCALDSDADGVVDAADRCAGTPRGLAVDAAGCPPDADGDGVIDVRDRCAATPAGAPVDEVGCPRDSDRDGVPDYLDRCADSTVDQTVDDVGCQVLFEEVEGERQPLVLRGVSFELGQAVLTEESFAILEQVAASLVVHAEVRAEVAGHTDIAGTPEFNQRLSLTRAETVRDFLISRGVAADRLVARGYGAEFPVASNATEEGRAMNRRVVLRLLTGEP